MIQVPKINTMEIETGNGILGNAINPIASPYNFNGKEKPLLSGIRNATKTAINGVGTGAKWAYTTADNALKYIYNKTAKPILDIAGVDENSPLRARDPIDFAKKLENDFEQTINENPTETPTTETKTETTTVESPSETDSRETDDMLSKIWERQDKIREHVEEREDNAYQRAVADMRKAGINPNLVNVNPAQSGGGVMQGGENLLSTEMQTAIQQALNEINNQVKMDENQKDRTVDILRTLSTAIILMAK